MTDLDYAPVSDFIIDIESDITCVLKSPIQQKPFQWRWRADLMSRYIKSLEDNSIENFVGFGVARNIMQCIHLFDRAILFVPTFVMYDKKDEIAVQRNKEGRPAPDFDFNRYFEIKQNFDQIKLKYQEFVPNFTNSSFQILKNLIGGKLNVEERWSTKQQ